MKANTPELMKFKRLQRRLRVNVAELCGLLELLWISTAKNAPRGDIGKFTNEEIAIGCYWEQDPDEFVDALIECGWLDESEEHRLVVHDWSDHAPSWVVGNLKRHGKTVIGKSTKEAAKCDSESTKQPTRQPAIDETQPTRQPARQATMEAAIGPSSKSSQVKSSQAKPSESSSELLSNPTHPPDRSEKFKQTWNRWKAHRNEKFQPLTPTAEDAALMELARCFPDDEESQIAAIEFSILRDAKNLILNGDHRAKASQRDSPSLDDRAARRKQLLSQIGKV